jgi:hypothetical protein
LMRVLAGSPDLAGDDPPNQRKCSFPHFPPGKMKKEKQSLKRHELIGMAERGTFREREQQVGSYFIAVKKDGQGRNDKS